VAVSLIALGITCLTASVPLPHRSSLEASTRLLASLGLKPAQAQRFDPNAVWQQVYEQLELPLENQYVSRETGEAAEDNTLVGRFIRYHIYTQGRPPIYRLDWKLTMADYLGVNEFISETTYPSADTLTTNPMEGDVAAIRRLNRAERDDLIQAIVDVFSASYSRPPATPAPDPTSSPASPAQPAQPTRPRTPQPGDADLLLP
jgi:hypothetical protein